jgi:hypothetical protein
MACYPHCHLWWQVTGCLSCSTEPSRWHLGFRFHHLLQTRATTFSLALMTPQASGWLDLLVACMPAELLPGTHKPRTELRLLHVDYGPNPVLPIILDCASTRKAWDHQRHRPGAVWAEWLLIWPGLHGCWVPKPAKHDGWGHCLLPAGLQHMRYRYARGRVPTEAWEDGPSGVFAAG